MKNILLSRPLVVLFFLLCAHLSGSAQDNPCKALVPGGGETAGTFFFNYGGGTNVRNLKYKQSFAIGMPLVGPSSSATYFGSFGFWSRFVAPPGAPTVVATQGDLLDRIQVSWNLDPLSSAPENGFKIYRDGIFLAQVDKTVNNYNDFNVIAGRPYIYEIRGGNQYGNGAVGTALGFQVPNGVVTGWVQTINGNPVPDALVALTPMQGFSVKMEADQAAGADSTGVVSFLPTHPDSSWSLCFWVKTQSVTGTAGLLSLTPAGLDISGASGGQPGIEVSYGGNVLFSKAFDTPGKDGWQHVAITFEGGRYRLFINGVLVALMPGAELPITNDLLLGALAIDSTGGWAGRLDELRIYHNVVLDELSLAGVMEGTASRLTPGLKYYWKMDEELGDKSFDVIKRLRLYFCGAKFDKDRPPVRTAGVTNEEGYYRIESANYGTGTTFLAQPMKDFYKHKALKFERNEGDYATLPNFPVTPKSTLELWVNSAGPDGDQVLLAKKWTGNDFRLLLREEGINNRIFFQLNGAEADCGLLGNNYQHLAFTIESGGASTVVTAYKNGTLINSYNLPAISGNWSDQTQPWDVGARKSGNVYTDHFDGLIDEVALYDTTLAQTVIQTHATSSRNAQERGLRIYFSFDEGSGNRLNNSGSYLSGFGTSFGTVWTPLAPNQMTTPHVFSPKTRQVTLNPSITSVDQVDFTDRSNVAVSGFVRYEGTDCFVNRAEILVNGESFKPQIFTDSLGRFTIDFEPGTSAFLSVKYENHNFLPNAWEVVNITSPIAGVLFSDVTKRKVKGQIAGGLCRKSIIEGPITDCRITARTLDGCYDTTLVVDAPNGKYEFSKLPPLEMTFSISKHNNPTIYKDFQTQGGRRIDLTQKDSSDVDFIYIAPPSVDVTGFDSYYKICQGQTDPTLDADGNPLVVLEEGQPVKLDIRVFEQYGPGQDPGDRCLLDSALLSIDNTFDTGYNFLGPLVDTMRNGKYDYDFEADNPNPNPPYLQIMQVTADVDGRKGTFIRKAMITGIIKGDRKFTTVSPMVPNFVLRDPPGDGSYAFLEKGETICNTILSEESGGAGPYFTLDVVAGPKGDVTFPAFPTVKFQGQAGVTAEFESRIIKTSNTSMDFCLTTTERISTDDGDLVVGSKTSLDGGKTILAGNDVYVGTAFNFIISDSRFLTFDDAACNVKLNAVTTLESDTFATTYMYSEWNIENNVIRYLDSLILDGQDPNGIISKSKQRWLDFIQMNTEAKAKAKYKKNISWDAGVQYEYSETRDTSTQVDQQVASQFEGLLGYLLLVEATGGGVGVDLELRAGSKFEGTTTDGTGKFTQRGTTVGYVLKDNDPGDTWTMDVKDDPLFKTPVFDIKAGQTSCPWEIGTARREGVKLTSLDGNTRLHVPSNGSAAFKFQLANNSQTGETFTYALTTGPESNPNGAKIFLNGGPLDKYVYYALPWDDGPLEVTIEVERGPTEYLYEGLELVFLSECHDIRSNALGFPPDDDPILYSAVYLTVQFDEPCSEVDISSPEEGWVVKPDNTNPLTQNLLPITVSGYDKKDPDLQGIRLQYRPLDGNGDWINITGGVPSYIPKDDLGDVFETYIWDTGGTPPLSDGNYEIRAITVCNGAPTDKPGISHVITGRIERQPPSIVGVPEPSDGVYNVGDEISFTFNKPINCNKLLEADIFNDNNVGLYDATTGKLIDIDISCYENKIVLNPKFQNEFFENKVIRAELHKIEDKIGNQLFKTDWEFVVDRNELAWLTDSFGLTKFEGEYKTGTAAIHNRGGYPVPFKITGAPSWVRVVPSAGTLVANQVLPIKFEVDSTLAFGRWSDSITLHTETGQNPFFMGGDELLPIGVRVVCRPPNWKVDPNLYENTMNMVLQLDIQGTISTDGEDIVAAYINDQLRGSAHLEYVPEVNKYLAYLTMYGNPDDQLDPVRFEIWDASECLRYGSVIETYTFQPDNVIGFIGSPVVLHTNSLVLREVPFGFGWNWLSFNLAFPDNSINAALASLKHPQSDLMKSQTTFSMYSGGWFGTLNNLSNTTMYIYRADVADTLRMMGNLINPATTNIPLVTGWNWIGYVPGYSLPTNEALSSLPSQPGDLIKGQLSFAQYFNSTFGWVGNLKYMSPPNGYQIKVAAPGTLTYPPPSQHKGADSVESRDPQLPSFWTVNPAQFEHSMTLIGMLKVNGQNATTATMELGVFAGNEVRGSAQAVYIAPLNAYQFFLTTYANAGGEQLKFKLFDAATGAVQELSETMWFSPDLHQGSIESPVPFTLKTSGVAEVAIEQSFDVQPNPFSTETMLRFALSHAQEVVISVVDVSGREVSRLQSYAHTGLNTVTWDGTSDAGLRLGAGVYLVRLNTEDGMVTRKVVLQR